MSALILTSEAIHEETPIYSGSTECSDSVGWYEVEGVTSVPDKKRGIVGTLGEVYLVNILLWTFRDHYRFAARTSKKGHAFAWLRGRVRDDAVVGFLSHGLRVMAQASQCSPPEIGEILPRQGGPQ
ncbi:hypothetical protein FB385_2678 [Paramicrobacterium agarici]|nr:hypothetical protein FB385_2678 [Microbacterium agarici]